MRMCYDEFVFLFFAFTFINSHSLKLQCNFNLPRLPSLGLLMRACMCQDANLRSNTVCKRIYYFQFYEEICGPFSFHFVAYTRLPNLRAYAWHWYANESETDINGRCLCYCGCQRCCCCCCRFCLFINFFLRICLSCHLLISHGMLLKSKTYRLNGYPYRIERGVH